MSIKSDRKKAIKAEKSSFTGAVPVIDFQLDNKSSAPNGLLNQLLLVGGLAARAKTAGIRVYAQDTDGAAEAHPHNDGKELHLPVPMDLHDPLRTAKELFRRIVTGWSFIANIQSGRNDGYAEMCKDCIEAIVKEHEELLRRIVPRTA